MAIFAHRWMASHLHSYENPVDKDLKAAVDLSSEGNINVGYTSSYNLD